MNVNKWQNMADIVSQHDAALALNLTRQYRRLCISRLLTENTLTFLLQYMGLMLTSPLIAHTAAPVWFASGTACAFIFMRGYSVLPGIILGSFFAYSVTSGHVLVAGLNAAIDAMQAGLLLWISLRYINPTVVFFNRYQFIKYIVCCMLVTAITSFLQIKNFNSIIYLQAWLGNLNGVCIFACAIVTWDMYFPDINQLKEMNKWSLSAAYSALGIIIFALILSHTPAFIIVFSLSTLPLMWLFSKRFGWCGIIAAVSVAGLLLNMAAYLDAPLFVSNYALLTSTYLQIILLLETIVGLYLAIVIKEKSCPHYSF